MKLRSHQPAAREITKAADPRLISRACAELEALAGPDCQWCPHPAVLVLIVHDVVTLGHCPARPEVFLSCLDCLRDVAEGIALDIAHQIDELPRGDRLQCRCGRVVRRMHDVLEIEAL